MAQHIVTQSKGLRKRGGRIWKFRSNTLPKSHLTRVPCVRNFETFGQQSTNSSHSLAKIKMPIFSSWNISLTLFAVSPSTGPLERSFSGLAKICYKDRNTLKSSNLETLYILAALKSPEIDFKGARELLKKWNLYRHINFIFDTLNFFDVHSLHHHIKKLTKQCYHKTKKFLLCFVF